MTTDFPFEEVPQKYKKIIGEPDPGTRLYRREGSQEDYEAWFKTVHDICAEGMVSPGGANMHAPVSRAAVYKALREGRLSAFFFHITEQKSWMGKKIKFRTTPYGYVSVSELKAWKADLLERAGNIQTIEDQETIRLEQLGTLKDEKGKEIYFYPKDRIKLEKEKARQAKRKK